MAPSIQCPYCSTVFSGVRATCPACGSRLPVNLRAAAVAAREAERTRREADRARKAAEKATASQRKEAQRQYQSAREEEAAVASRSVQEQIEALQSILAAI